ncbi:SDR family oxidoreductase [Streptomyces iranensis]|uniref:NAD(P)-dependent dehydrogenase (Short-subunit alcohol dehydrogenase family) n=1 Tax=Streptomyces iranensis TaxID=576784 RepID=A0A060ZDU8_9ACTN|nr:SDR family oxidoreductase [Streptomyces iranensis]MBP2066319.1 NAD(P)-dependent dehydrogenase (short-subunit alcohol dehydrogenase family) [Streptomyces iranensis]CDR02909.1 short-chain dehydrogenase/reductase SDR [Streptomyces iranensis]
MVAIDGSVVLVTGGQRGIGKAYVEALLRRGAAKVYATARKPVPSEDPRVEAVSLDVNDADAVAALADRATDVDIVINNAGVLLPSPLLTADMADVVATFETNVFGPLRVARAFAPVLAARGGGALVDMHSVLSWGAGAAAYGASKAALWSITNSLRIELAEQGTQVVGVHLGLADTDMVAGIPSQKISPAEVVEAVLDGVESGGNEVLVDAVTRQMKAALAGPVEGLTLLLGR